MAETIEIDLSNPQTVTVPQWAREETQLQIKELLGGKGPAKGFGKDLKEATKGAKGFDKSLKSAIPGPAKFGSMALGAAESLANFGTTILKTSLTTKGALTDLNVVLDAQADLIDQTLGQIPLIGGAISYLNRAAVELTKQVNIIFEELASSFEGASASGASFGGNMTDYATKVLGANVRLDTFQNILRSNADAFAQLGGTVTGGAEKFLRLNRIVTHIERDGEMVARNFRGLGMTLQDVAELNADILDIQMRDFRFRDLTEREQATIIDKTIMQFATLGRLTGKRADQVAKEVKEAATRGDVAAGLAAISEQGLEQFGRASELLAPFGQNIQEAFAQLSAGIAPTGDAATALALLGDDVFQQMETLAKMVRSGVTTNEDMNKQSAILEQSLRDNAKAEEFRSIAALGSLGGIPSLAADIYSGSANLIANNISSLERFQIAADETAKALNPEDGLTKEVLNAKASLEGLGL